MKKNYHKNADYIQNTYANTLLMNLRILGICFALMLYSCGKDAHTNSPNPIPTPEPGNCKITKITYGSLTGGQLGLAALTDFDVSYTNNNITQLIATSRSPQIGKVIFLYDTSNRLVEKDFYNIGDPQVQYKIEYIYDNPLHHLLTEVDYWWDTNFFHINGHKDYYYDYIHSIPVTSQVVGYYKSNGQFDNQTDVTWEHSDPTLIETSYSISYIDEIITYDTTKENKFNQTFPNFYLQDIYKFIDYNHYDEWEFISKHMITKVTENSTIDNEESIPSGNYTYTYNSQNLIKEIKIDGNIFMRFSYSCD